MWNPEKQIARMSGVANKLVATLEKKGITFTSSDGDLENVIFTHKDKTIKMSKHSFYRFSGIACMYNFKDESKVEVVEVTDEMYMTTFIKPIIEARLEVK